MRNTKIAEQEFSLNLKHQVGNPKHPVVVGYRYDDDLAMFSVIIPKKCLPKKLRNKILPSKFWNKKSKEQK